MPKFRQTRYLLLALMVILSLVACQRSAKVPDELPQELRDVLPEGKVRPVEVVLASPRGEINHLEASQSIVVGFNQPMVPLRPVSGEVKVDFVEFEPPIEGRFRWKGTATLVFEPRSPLPYASRYKIRVKKGVQSLTKQALAEDFSFDFVTPTVALTHSLPVSGSVYQGVNDPLYLHFNQPVDLQSLENGLQLVQTKEGGGTSVVAVSARAYTEEDRKAEGEAARLQEAYDLPRVDGVVQAEVSHSAVIMPKQPLMPGLPTRLILKAGLKSPQGAVATTQERTLEFTTRPAFKLQMAGWSNPDPENGLVLGFSSPVAASVLRKAMTVEPAVELPEFEEDAQYATHSPYLGGKLKPNTRYKIKLDESLRDRFGEPLVGDRETILTTTDFTPLLMGPEGSGILELQGGFPIPYGIRNLSRLTASYRTLTPAEVVRLYSMEGALYSSVGSFVPPGGYTATRDLGGNKRRNEIEERRLALPGGGLYYVCVQEDSYRNQRALVAVSEVGITVKSSPEQVVVFASSFKDARPVSGVNIELLDDKGKSLWSGKTDSEGFCQAPGWGQLQLAKKEIWSAPNLWVFASHGKSRTFLSTSGYQSVGPWAFDIDYESNQFARTFQAFAFSERGVYRPGESVQLKGSVRELTGGSWKLPELDRIAYKVFDSRDREIGKGDLEINRFGAFDQVVALKPEAATGLYRVEYRLLKSLADSLKWDRELTTVSFQVEAFKPAQFEVQVSSDKPHYIAGDKGRFEFKGWYLFGAPMNGRPLEWSARIEPTTLRPEGFEGYDFGLEFQSDRTDEPRLLSSGNATLDEKGLASTSVSLESLQYRGGAQLIVEGVSTSPNRQRLAGRKVVPLYRAEVQLGLKPASFFASAGKAQAFQVVAVRPDGQTQQGVEVKLELLRRQWNSVRKADSSGRYSWVSEVKDEKISEKTLRSATDPVSHELTPERAGYYVVRASASDSRSNTTVTESGFYATGSDYVAWSRSDQDTVDLVPDKRTYKPGDVANILVKSPFEKCRALVTLERENVMDRRVVELQGTAATLEIPLTQRHLPNVYVSVMLLRGREAQQEFGPDGQDLSKPAFKLGYVNLPVEPAEKKLEVKISLEKERYAPGEEVVADLQVSGRDGQPVEAEICLSVPDQGVLALTGYQLPDWFSFFYGARPLAILTSENRMDIIGQRAYGSKGANAGGGGGFESDHVRENFRYTAYWNPSLVTDAQGKAQARFTLPDNTTTFRLMAMAQSRGSDFGSAEAKFEVQKTLMMQPSLPGMARVGDEFQGGVVVRNNSKESLSVKLGVETEGLNVVGQKERSITLAGGKEQEVLFSFKAEQLGPANLKFVADGGKASDSLKLPLRIAQTLVLENVSSSGNTEDSATLEMVIPSPMLAGTGVLRSWLSSSALVGLESPLEQIFQSTYVGLEVQLSRIQASLASRPLRDLLSIEPPASSLESWLEALRAYEVNGKGYASFQGGERPDPYLTAYALETLFQSRQAGIKVDNALVDCARAFLKDFLNQPDKTPIARRSSPEELRTLRCFALYALSLDSFDGLSYFNNLMRSRLDISLEGRIYLLLAGRRLGASATDLQTLEQDLLNAAKTEAATCFFQDDGQKQWRWSFPSKTKLTALGLRALLESKKPDPRLSKMVTWLMEARNAQGSWGNTHDNARVLSALEHYFRSQEGKEPNFTATVFLQKKEIQSARFQGRKAPVDKASSPVPSGEQKLALALKKEGPGRLYYQIRLSYAPEKEAPARDEGLVVLKKISTLDGKRFPVELKAGETYKVVLTVVSPLDRRFVVVSDPIPAGCEVVQTQFETESAEMSRILAASQGLDGSYTFQHFEKYPDRVDLFADGLQAGEHTFQYLIRANQPGKFRMPATRAEEMYHPEVFGTTLAREVVIR